MNQQQLTDAITAAISKLEWPDPDSIRREERKLIADAIRRAGYGANIMTNGRTLPDWISSGSYNSSRQDTYFKTILLGNGVGLDLVHIPAGSFLMGSLSSEEGHRENEGPQHEVTLESFFLGRTPITQAQWREVASWPKVGKDLDPDPSHLKGADRPVERVTWFEAMEFCSRLSQRSGKTCTLPSEAQWEYACRAGTTTPFAFGETLTTQLANYDGTFTYGTYRQETSEAGSYPANGWGLQDMHGNVWEWCADYWHGSHAGAPRDGRPWLEENVSARTLKVLRGGSWASFPVHCRSAFRFFKHPANLSDHVGFRVCCLP